MIKRVHVVAEQESEIETFELEKLKEVLTSKFGSRGLEFMIEYPSSDPVGVAAVYSIQYDGFAIFNITIDAISAFVQEWASARGPIIEHPDLY